MQVQNDPEAAQRHLSEVTAIWKKYDCHPVKSLAPLLVSAPVFISFYFAISRMADGIGSFKDGGTLWFTDLSISDPTMMMPLLTSALFLASVELGAVEGMNNNQQGVTMKVGSQRISRSSDTDDVEFYTRRVLLLDHK